MVISRGECWILYLCSCTLICVSARIPDGGGGYSHGAAYGAAGAYGAQSGGAYQSAWD